MSEQENLSPNTEENSSPNNDNQVQDDPSLVANDPVNTEIKPNLGDQGGEPNADGKNWYDGLQSEDIKSHPKIKEFKSADALAKSYLELQSVLGNEKMPIPKDENDTLAIDMVKKALGVPDEPTGYNLEQPQVPEGLEGVMFGMEEFTTIAHRHGLTPTQATGLMNDYVGLLGHIQTQSKEQFMQGLENTKNDLKQEWGLTYDTKVKMAQQVMNKFTGSKEEFDQLNARLGTDPTSLKFLAKMGEQFAEGTLGDMGDHQSRFTKSPADAKKEYDAIMSDPNDVYWSGVRNQNVVSESARKDRIAYVESLLMMQST